MVAHIREPEDQDVAALEVSMDYAHLVWGVQVRQGIGHLQRECMASIYSI